MIEGNHGLTMRELSNAQVKTLNLNAYIAKFKTLNLKAYIAKFETLDLKAYMPNSRPLI